MPLKVRIDTKGFIKSLETAAIKEAERQAHNMLVKINCPKCGTIVNSIVGENLCPNCKIKIIRTLNEKK